MRYPRNIWSFSLLIISLVLLSHAITRAQLVVTEATQQEVIENFLGVSDGISILSTTFVGNPNQMGLFTGGTSAIGIEEGFALTTGDLEYANQNHDNVCTGGENEIESDHSFTVDQGYLGTSLMFNPVLFEIEFVSSGTDVSFDFVWASEEYPHFVNSSYTDAFGFFISGPGFNGPFPGNSENIAMLPNGGGQIDVDNVSASMNSEFFIDNTCENQPSLLPFPYQGLTIPITIQANVECDEIYKLTVVLSNIGDANRDAAVFFKKGSFSADYFVAQEVIATPQPVCNGDLVTLFLEGEPDCSYAWSNGVPGNSQVGTGLSTIQVVADVDNPTWSVELTCPSGCLGYNREITLDIDSDMNEPPYTNGINGSGEYTYYTQAGQPFCFSLQTHDSPNESVEILSVSNLPPGMTYTVIPGPYEAIEFCWTPEIEQFGEYDFFLTYEDDNSCGSGSNTDHIIVKVLCSYCEMEVVYDNRTPTNNPLPELTEAGLSITAGLNGHVDTGDELVTFRAPEIILGGQNGNAGSFNSGSNFIAEYGDACLDDCDQCCLNWNGFTNLPLTNVITPNGDGFNDVWYVQDPQHPNQAFGAVAFDFEIRQDDGVLVYSLSENPGYCWPFTAPEIDGIGEYSSIYWPGTYNSLIGPGQIFNGCHVEDGTYFYTLELEGPCGDIEGLSGFITVLASPGPSNCNPVFRESAPDLMDPDLSETGQEEPGVRGHSELVLSYDANYRIAHARVFGDASYHIDQVELFDMSGRKIFETVNCGKSCSIDLSSQPSGIYLFRAITTEGVVDLLKLMKAENK